MSDLSPCDCFAMYIVAALAGGTRNFHPTAISTKLSIPIATVKRWFTTPLFFNGGTGLYTMWKDSVNLSVEDVALILRTWTGHHNAQATSTGFGTISHKEDVLRRLRIALRGECHGPTCRDIMMDHLVVQEKAYRAQTFDHNEKAATKKKGTVRKFNARINNRKGNVG